MSQYDLSQYKGVAIYAESRENLLEPVAKELLSEGRKLADKLQVELHAVLVGNEVKKLADDCILFGADRVIVIQNHLLTHFSPEPYTRSVATYINQYKPEIMLFPATTTGRDIAARIAIRCETGLTADSIILDIDLEKRLFLQTRPAFGGNIMATITSPVHRPQLSTVRPNVFQPMPLPNHTGQVEELTVDFEEIDFRLKIKEIIQEAPIAHRLEDAQIVVAGGRGMQTCENFALLKEFADAIGGVVGATRPPVDSNWISHHYQIGQTGKTIRPKVYFACGISGAIQHTIGIQSPEILIAINKDPNAPIFKMANLGIVGDVFEILPRLITAFK